MSDVDHCLFTTLLGEPHGAVFPVIVGVSGVVSLLVCGTVVRVMHLDVELGVWGVSARVFVIWSSVTWH